MTKERKFDLQDTNMKVGLALGGGGAKGLAHIPMFMVLDDLKVKPHRVTGTSIGAIMGALYCAGLSGNEIKNIVKKMVLPKKPSLKKVFDKDALKWIDFIDFDIKGKGILKGDGFINFLHDHLGVSTFEELKIPLAVVASDFWTGEQVIINSGELLPAIKASMGLPGTFSPIVIDDRVLIDGGGVNPLPHDIITDCDKIIAIDVMGRPEYDSKSQKPHLVESVLGMFDIMQRSIIKQRLLQTPPDIYIKPNIHGIDILDFYKAVKIVKQALPASADLKLQLEKMLKAEKN